MIKKKLNTQGKAKKIRPTNSNTIKWLYEGGVAKVSDPQLLHNNIIEKLNKTKTKNQDQLKEYQKIIDKVLQKKLKTNNG